MPMAVVAHGNYRTIERVEGRKQGRGAIPLVIVRHRSTAAFLQWQAWLRAVQCLNLALLVSAQHDGMFRRVQI